MAGQEDLSKTCEHTERDILVWQSSLANAKQCLLQKNYGRAFAHFLLVLKLCPSMKCTVEDDFILCMREWTESLERQDRIHDVFRCYDQACELFPECESALNNMGAQLFRLGYPDEAALYIRRALKLNPDFLPARENLENICSHLVERWHFRMLNDMTRNTAFRDAIDLAVSQGYNTVLDIGAGTGLLSLFAEESGAVVHACEASKSMYEVAKDVIAANSDASEKINLLPKLSLDLTIPQDIPARVSLVITETFDAGLFGEHVISTLHHAWQNLLLPPSTMLGHGGRVLPAGATVYLCPVESEMIRKQNRLLYPVLLSLDLQGIHINCRTSNDDNEPYTTECLSSMRGGYRFLAKPVQALKINFCDPLEVAAFHSGYENIMNITITQGGKLDAIVMWFDLDLDKNVTITTEPHVANCWEQAVFPVLASHFVHCHGKDDVRENFAVKEGDSVRIKCHLHNDCFKVVCRDVTRGHNSSRAEGPSMATPKVNSENHIFSLSQCEILRLNDITMNRHCIQALEAVKPNSSHSPSLLHLADGLSPLGLQATFLGYSDVTMTMTSDEYKEIICCIADINHIPREKLSFCASKDILELDEEFDVIQVDLFESSGVLRQQILEDLALARLTSLKHGGVILPGKVTVMGLCVESETLAKSSFVVTSEYTLGIQIADYIRDFQTTTHLDVDLHTLTYKKLCEPFTMFHLDFNDNQPSGDLPEFLQQEREVSVMLTDSGSLHAVVYWFEVKIVDDNCFSTLDSSLHWKQAAKMMKSNVSVSSGQSLSLRLVLKNSCIDVQPVI